MNNLKRLTIVLMLLPFLFGQVIVREKTVTVAWDLVTGEGITYEVFIAPSSDKATAQLYSSTDLLEMIVDLPAEGQWVIGVRSVKSALGDTLYSGINWSDANGEATPVPFVLRYLEDPDAPKGFRFLP